MAIEKLKLTTKDPMQTNYSWIGFFKTFAEANKWYISARKAGVKYPFLCYKRDGKGIVGDYSLWWMKPKNSKTVGKGWGK